MFHYARITKDYDHSEVEGPEVFHFVAIAGDDDWVEVQLEEPLHPDHEELIRRTIADHLAESVTCHDCGAESDGMDVLEHEPGCEKVNVTGTLPMRITRRFLRLQGADFVEIGE